MAFITIVCCLCIRFYYHSLLFLDNTLDVCIVYRGKSHSVSNTMSHTKKNENFHIVMWCAGSSLALEPTHSNWHDNCFQIDSSIWMYINRFHTWHQFLFYSRQRRKNTKEYRHSSARNIVSVYASIFIVLPFDWNWHINL